MKAVILEDIGKLKVTTMDIPTCGPGEVLVKLEACGICRTDLKCYTMGQRDLYLPRILGHEVAGTVAAMGENVTNLFLGDRVQSSPRDPLWNLFLLFSRVRQPLRSDADCGIPY